MKRIRREAIDGRCPFSFNELSYESYVFGHLYHLHRFLESEGQLHALFGGAAVAAYCGHLPRRIHDIDLIIPDGEETALVSHLCSDGFREQRRKKSRRARFRKFLLEDDRYQMIVSIFPGRFTLVDLADPSMKPVGTYDFREALDRRILRPIYALGGEGHVPVVTIPIEDLIVTKLWPTLEPNLIYDLVLLLCSDAAQRLDFPYLVARVRQAEEIASITLRTLRRLPAVYDKSLWSRGLPQQDEVKAQIQLLISALDQQGASEQGR